MLPFYGVKLRSAILTRRAKSLMGDFVTDVYLCREFFPLNETPDGISEAKWDAASELFKEHSEIEDSPKFDLSAGRHSGHIICFDNGSYIYITCSEWGAIEEAHPRKWETL